MVNPRACLEAFLEMSEIRSLGFNPNLEILGLVLELILLDFRWKPTWLVLIKLLVYDGRVPLYTFLSIFIR